VPRDGASRRRIARTLNAAYADGLISEATFLHRVDQLLQSCVIDPPELIGDLNLRGAERGIRVRLSARVSAAVRRYERAITGHAQQQRALLALDWSGGQQELLVGRHHACDVVLSNLSVSRKHARLVFRDGSWVLQDLGSTNGTVVNGVNVGRCELRPGDRISLGDEHLQID
jgi:hypothetical protein